MSKVPAEPKFTASVLDTAVVPTGTMPEPQLPEGVDSMDEQKKTVVRSAAALAAQTAILVEQQQQQYKRVEDRCSSEQWLDENEREWYAMDTMIRSRPWAARKDQPFPYPFRDATNLMRNAEGPWVGDIADPPNRPWTRAATTPSDVLIHLRPVAEHPPLRRLIMFLPEFGSADSYSAAVWKKLAPLDTCDVWLVSWQGWADFDEMVGQLLYKVLSFADATSTVWFAHSAGAIVAYEVLKRFEKHHSPNLPVALVVSGCPAPHLFAEKYRPAETFSWLKKLQTEADFALLTPEQHEALLREFQVARLHEVDALTLASLQRGLLTGAAKEKYDGMASLTSAQKFAVINDLKVMGSYNFNQSSKPVLVPVVAMCHDEDPLITPEDVEAWREYALSFEFVALEDVADGEVLAQQGHGYTMNPVPELLAQVTSFCDKFQLVKEVDEILPDFGPTDGDFPAEIDCLIVGAGIAGITQAKVLVEGGMSVLVVDRYRTIGGIWMYYANNFSRVNSSEPAYRIVNQEGPGSRPNEDHSPRHDILRDIFTVANKFLYGKIRCNQDVTKVKKREDGTWDITVKGVNTGQVSKVHAKAVSFHVNRRIGQRRDLTWPGSNNFRGEEVYGYANEVLGLNFWGKRVIVVGAGAFAFENLRTALEHGAKHVMILGRRAGTTCPKWIDMIAFLRPLDHYFNTNKNGNIISFDVWRKCYEDAGLRTPECWDEGLLKPHNHTVSVSDLAFIGGYHGMVDLRVGEIRCFRNDGQGVELMDGTLVDTDVIIKATGFHLNAEVPKITGYTHIHSNGLMDFNINYGAEPLLDGGQFGSSKGKMESTNTEQLDEMAVAMGMQEAQKLGLPDFQPRANPFGSAYVGGMLSTAYNFRWLLEHQDYQKDLLKTVGEPQQSCVETWVSQLGVNAVRTMYKLFEALK